MGEIETKTDLSAVAIPGAKGQFDVLLDGRLLFSKQSAGRFPEHDEVLALVS